MRILSLVPVLLIVACQGGGLVVDDAPDVGLQEPADSAARVELVSGNDLATRLHMDDFTTSTGVWWEVDEWGDLNFTYQPSRSGFALTLTPHEDVSVHAAFGEWDDVRTLAQQGARTIEVDQLVAWTNFEWGADPDLPMAQRAFLLQRANGEWWAVLIDSVDVDEEDRWTGSGTIELSMAPMSW